MSLQQIGLKYGTDKATFHQYCSFYEGYLPKPTEVKALIEIGVLENKSLLMWEEYYPQAQIYGIDFVKKTHYDKNRIKTFIANQSNRKQLLDIITKTGNVDIIIDDGGHSMEQQQVSLATLLPHTKYYVVEDLCTSLLPLGNTFGVTDEENTVLTGLIRFMRKQSFQHCFKFLSGAECDILTQHIDTIYLLWNYVQGTTPLTAIIKTKQA